MSLRMMNRGQRRAVWREKGAAAPVAAPNLRGPARLEIGALVLKGFDRRVGLRVAAAFERQMMELMRGGTVPQEWRGARSGAVLRGGRVQVASVSDPVGIGERLAEAVFRSQVDSRGRRGGEA